MWIKWSPHLAVLQFDSSQLILNVSKLFFCQHIIWFQMNPHDHYMNLSEHARAFCINGKDTCYTITFMLQLKILLCCFKTREPLCLLPVFELSSLYEAEIPKTQPEGKKYIQAHYLPNKVSPSCSNVIFCRIWNATYLPKKAILHVCFWQAMHGTKIVSNLFSVACWPFKDGMKLRLFLATRGPALFTTCWVCTMW